MFGGDGNPGKMRSELRGVRTVHIPRRYMLWLLKHRGFKMTIRNYVGILDGMLDFYFAHRIASYATAKTNRRKWQIVAELHRHARKYPPHFSLVYFLDNHDLTRYLFRVNNNPSKLLEAVRLMFSLKGAKVIYYGTEVGVTQEKDFTAMKQHGDIQARMPMPWNPAEQNQELLREFKRIIANRTHLHR